MNGLGGLLGLHFMAFKFKVQVTFPNFFSCFRSKVLGLPALGSTVYGYSLHFKIDDSRCEGLSSRLLGAWFACQGFGLGFKAFVPQPLCAKFGFSGFSRILFLICNIFVVSFGTEGFEFQGYIFLVAEWVRGAGAPHVLN